MFLCVFEGLKGILGGFCVWVFFKVDLERFGSLEVLLFFIFEVDRFWIIWELLRLSLDFERFT